MEMCLASESKENSPAVSASTPTAVVERDLLGLHGHKVCCEVDMVIDAHHRRDDKDLVELKPADSSRPLPKDLIYVSGMFYFLYFNVVVCLCSLVIPLQRLRR